MAELTACRIFISLVAAAMLSLLFGLVRNEALNLDYLTQVAQRNMHSQFLFGNKL